MCQHCNHAPCETVCPVVATNHSSEGLNQMAYNRCIGTRYCANNCPYKVRRFNWFQYDSNEKFATVNPAHNTNVISRMVLNPDVVVRARGVMEKCSLCVQRIQDGKLTAKRESRKVKDGEIKTACMQACPTNAIVFGDYNDKSSELNKMWKPEERSYHLLEELDVQPNVFYQVKVRNVEPEMHSKES
jgi:molybdopterin-containing oxidoreductase family iron-sulfur binding subunit